MMWYDHGMGWWSYAGMGIGIVLFAALLIFGIAGLVSLSTRDDNRRLYLPPSPERILGERFARGDISEAEYREALAVLREHAHH